MPSTVTGPRKPPRSATARRVASNPRQRPRSAQDRGGRNRVPLGARRGPERGGCGDPHALGAWPALCCRVRAGPRRVKSGTCERPESEGLGTSLRMCCGGTRAGPAGGDSERLQEDPGKKTPGRCPGLSEAQGSARRAGARMQPGLGSPDCGGGRPAAQRAELRDRRPEEKNGPQSPGLACDVAVPERRRK